MKGKHQHILDQIDLIQYIFLRNGSNWSRWEESVQMGVNRVIHGIQGIHGLQGYREIQGRGQSVGANKVLGGCPVRCLGLAGSSEPARQSPVIAP